MTGFLFEIHGNETQAQARAEEHRLAEQQAKAREGERRKREGMQRAAMSKPDLLGYARELAVDLAKQNGGLCHADMVAAALEKEGRPGLGNAAGSLFLSHVWEWTGDRVKSTRPHAHANELKLWRLRHA